MKLIIALLFFVSSICHANPMKLTYQENYPGQKNTYTFMLKTHCKTSFPLRVKKFESEEMFSDTITGTPQPVRVIHLYATTYGQECNKRKAGSVSKTIEIPPDEKRMTHIYITSDEKVAVRSEQ